MPVGVHPALLPSFAPLLPHSSFSSCCFPPSVLSSQSPLISCPFYTLISLPSPVFSPISSLNMNGSQWVLNNQNGGFHIWESVSTSPLINPFGSVMGEVHIGVGLSVHHTWPFDRNPYAEERERKISNTQNQGEIKPEDTRNVRQGYYLWPHQLSCVLDLNRVHFHSPLDTFALFLPMGGGAYMWH